MKTLFLSLANEPSPTLNQKPVPRKQNRPIHDGRPYPSMRKSPSSNIDTAKPPKILFTLTGGGYLWEAMQLINQISADIEYLYATTSNEVIPSFSEIPEGEVYRISRVTTLSEKHFFKKSVNFLKCLFQSLRLINKTKPKMIICVGSSISIPLCLAGKLHGTTTVFIESVARVDRLSKTGKILRKLKLCDHLFVQWPEILPTSKGIKYAGTIL